mmetsp:Transcript_8405/g.13137  ORF Transcript_8405/g.13137 Transcript_8405/m.13137 type:complete len:229 (+) Transcript_8405:23-709(+)
MLEDFRKAFGKPLMEAIGTFVLLLTIQLSVDAPSADKAPMAIGVVLMVMIYAGAPISGAHYNPAVSLALWLRGKQTVGEMLIYWIFQLAGGTFGAWLGGIISGTYSYIGVGKNFTLTQALLAEICFAFVLCFVVLGTATHSKAAGNGYYGAAIGLTVTAGAVSVGQQSGAAFNPAVALGLSMAGDFERFGYCCATALADLFGGALAAGVFYMVAPDQFDISGEYESVA